MAVHLRSLKTAGELQKEHVLPAAALQGAGFQLYHVQSVDGENGEDLMETARFVGGVTMVLILSAPVSKLHVGGDHHKAGGVDIVVVDSGGQNIEAVDVRSPCGADGGFGDVAGLGHIFGASGGVCQRRLYPIGMIV